MQKKVVKRRFRHRKAISSTYHETNKLNRPYRSSIGNSFGFKNAYFIVYYAIIEDSKDFRAAREILLSVFVYRTLVFIRVDGLNCYWGIITSFNDEEKPFDGIYITLKNFKAFRNTVSQ